MTAAHVVTVTLDAESRLDGALRSILAGVLLGRTAPAEHAPVLAAIEQLATIKSDQRTAAGANELVIVLEPSEALLSLCLAMSAPDADGLAGHNSPSNAVGSGEHSIAGAEAGVMPVSDAGGAAA
jgi:hypothetical protein